MKVPIFLSSPTALNKTQEASRNLICKILDDFELEPRALGRSDYPTDLPLREVHVIAKHCSGGVILGYTQFISFSGTWKPGTKEEKPTSGNVVFPTPWNNLEAGILFSLGLPLLVFKEEGISGGVFDSGVTDVFVHKMPMGRLSPKKEQDLRAVFLKWQSRVRERYYA